MSAVLRFNGEGHLMVHYSTGEVEPIATLYRAIGDSAYFGLIDTPKARLEGMDVSEILNNAKKEV